jgi:inner membrane protein
MASRKPIGKTEPTPEIKTKNEGLSIGLRLFIIAVLSIVLLIPSLLLHVLIHDRDQRKDSVVLEVADQWSGGGQTLAAPIMTLPYKEYFKDEKGHIQYNIVYAHFLPETLNLTGTMEPEIRYRGIYKVALYQATLQVSGTFRFPNIADLNIKASNILWKDAFITLGMSNTKSIQEKVLLHWNQKAFLAEPGVKCTDVVDSGISVKIPLKTTTQEYKFAFALTHAGHDFLEFVPLGKTTDVTLSAPWGDPSFYGSFLPDERVINESDFSANWKIIDINRNFPQQWKGQVHSIRAASFGVRLFTPVDHYLKTTRTVKYAIMFIGLTFLALFMLDVLIRSGQKPVHPIQYLLIGIALVVFYTLLLSLSEHLGFAGAYGLASLAIVILITLYTKSVLNNILHTGLMAGILVVLYSYLYIVLQLEDFALLIGSVSLFVILSIVMYLTRKIDWSDIGGKKLKNKI